MNKITDKIYHGCETRYANDERKLIDFEKCEKCQVSTSEPFWKKPTECCMETRNLTKERQLPVGPFKINNKTNSRKYIFCH